MIQVFDSSYRKVRSIGSTLLRVRKIGWVLIAISELILVFGVWWTVSYMDTYSYKGLTEMFTQGWWILAAAALPGLTGWLLVIRNPKPE